MRSPPQVSGCFCIVEAMLTCRTCPAWSPSVEAWGACRSFTCAAKQRAWHRSTNQNQSEKRMVRPPLAAGLSADLPPAWPSGAHHVSIFRLSCACNLNTTRENIAEIKKSTLLIASTAPCKPMPPAVALISGSGVTLYFLQIFKYMVCSWPTYLAIKLSISALS